MSASLALLHLFYVRIAVYSRRLFLGVFKSVPPFFYPSLDLLQTSDTYSRNFTTASKTFLYQRELSCLSSIPPDRELSDNPVQGFDDDGRRAAITMEPFDTHEIAH